MSTGTLIRRRGRRRRARHRRARRVMSSRRKAATRADRARAEDDPRTRRRHPPPSGLRPAARERADRGRARRASRPSRPRRVPPRPSRASRRGGPSRGSPPRGRRLDPDVDQPLGRLRARHGRPARRRASPCPPRASAATTVRSDPTLTAPGRSGPVRDDVVAATGSGRGSGAGPGQVPAATRTLRVLRFLASQPDPVPLDRIARACDLPRCTAYHLLNAMIAEGFVVHLADEHRYGLGVAAFEVGSGYARQEPLHGSPADRSPAWSTDRPQRATWPSCTGATSSTCSRSARPAGRRW